MPEDEPDLTEAPSTLAIVATSSAPLLLLSSDLRIIASSLSFRRAFGVDPGSPGATALPQLGSGEWNVPQLLSLLNATAAGLADVDAYEMDLVRRSQETRRLVVNAHKLDYGDPSRVRLVMAVTDVTVAREAERAKDDLLREKTVLLMEVQHRVANSLQIIASILMQSARSIQSEEARGQLKDAQLRVLSLAAMQRQLSVQGGTVPMRPYLDQLCASLGASMIADPTRLSIVVEADNADAPAETSVSVGLLVTELVINALKHAFPDGRGGRIRVSYACADGDWTLTVSDDGVGMQADSVRPVAGLGTRIVQALVNQLKARVVVSDARPGTSVRIVHNASSRRDAPADAL